MKNFKEKINIINNTRDGIEFCDTVYAINKAALKFKLSAEELSQYRDCLMEYCFTGPITFHRSHALSSLTDVMSKGDRRYADKFLILMKCGDDHLEYWAVEAYARSVEKCGYHELVAFILAADKHKLNSRANAVKVISAVSNQRFDAGKSKDPGQWEKSDINLTQILQWQKDGYPEGIGYTVPTRHPSLDKPKTELEKIMSKLDKKLLKERSREQDLSNPGNWQVVSEPARIKEIEKFVLPHKLPEVYKLFLEQYSPLNCSFAIRISEEDSVDIADLHISSADDLIEYQQGYSVSGDEAISGWPANYLVIADSGADPFCINLAQENSPVYYAQHGCGSWEFDVEYDSLILFFKAIIIDCE